MPDVPRRRQEVPRGARRLQRLSPQGRQAQRLARRRLRRLPYAGELEGDALRSRQDALRAHRQARRHALQGLPRDRRLQEHAADVRRLPPQGRQQAAPRPARARSARPATAREGLEGRHGVPARPRHEVPAARQASDREVRELPRRPPRPCGRSSSRRASACHKADDKHNGTLGTACADCHTERELARGEVRSRSLGVQAARKASRRRMQGVPPRSEELQGRAAGLRRLPQEGRHAQGALRHQVRDLPHRRVRGRTSRFRHDVDTKYRLLGKHVETKCDTCHTARLYDGQAEDRLLFVPPQGRQAPRPARPRSATPATTRPTGSARCASTTTSRAFRYSAVTQRSNARTAMRRRPTRTRSANASRCHEKDDKHKRTLGTDCGECHNARDWKIWDFDHTRRTKYALDGAHARCLRDLPQGAGRPRQDAPGVRDDSASPAIARMIRTTASSARNARAVIGRARGATSSRSARRRAARDLWRYAAARRGVQ